MKNLTVKFAIGSTVNDGLLCKDGTGNYKVSTEFESGDRYYGDIKLFDTKQEAQDFIESNEWWALQVVEYAPTKMEREKKYHYMKTKRLVHKYQIIGLLKGFEDLIYFDKKMQVLRVYEKFGKITSIVNTKFNLTPFNATTQIKTFCEYQISHK